MIKRGRPCLLGPSLSQNRTGKVPDRLTCPVAGPIGGTPFAVERILNANSCLCRAARATLQLALEADLRVHFTGVYVRYEQWFNRGGSSLDTYAGSGEGRGAANPGFPAAARHLAWRLVRGSFSIRASG